MPNMHCDDLAAVFRLLNEARSIVDAIAARSAPTADAPRPQNKTTAPPPRWSSLPTKWPIIGGSRFSPAPSGIFESPEFKAAFQPGAERAAYVACCPAIKKIACQLQIPISKVSTCGAGRLQERLAELDVDSYGDTRKHGPERVAETGWNRWDAVCMSPGLKPAPGSPVRVATRALVFTMPAGLATDDFDNAFDAEIRKASLSRWLRGKKGAAHCQLVGADPSIAQRFTSYDFDGAPRVSAAAEIVAFRTAGDQQRLVQIIEKIIARLVGVIA